MIPHSILLYMRRWRLQSLFHSVILTELIAFSISYCLLYIYASQPASHLTCQPVGQPPDPDESKHWGLCWWAIGVSSNKKRIDWGHELFMAKLWWCSHLIAEFVFLLLFSKWNDYYEWIEACTAHTLNTHTSIWNYVLHFYNISFWIKKQKKRVVKKWQQKLSLLSLTLISLYSI